MVDSTLKKATVAVLILATLMVLALTASIALLFTIGKPTTTMSNNQDQSSNLLPQPCICGCPAISPQVTPRIVNGETAVPHS